MKVGYAPSWIIGSHLETTEFHVATVEYFQDYPHLSLQ
jgi:hypothetical protein